MTVKKNNNIAISLLILLFIIMSSFLTLSFSVFVMQLLLAAVTIPLILKKDYKIKKLYLLIFIVSITFIFLIYLANQFYYGIPYYIGGSDDLMFEKWGLDVYYSNLLSPSNILESGVLPEWHNSPLFPIYISILIRFANFFDGYSTFLPRIINVYFLIWICFFMEYFLRRYAKFSEKKIFMSIAIFALTPNIQYINSHVFRDTFNLLQIFSIAYIADQILTNKNYLRKILFVCLLGFLLFITYYTRKNSLAFAGILWLLIISKKFKIKKRYIFIAIIPVIFATNFLEALNIERLINGYSSYLLDGSRGGLSAYVFGQPLLPLGVFFRAFYAFITPFPNFFGLFKDPTRILFDLVTLLIYLGVLVQILAIPFIIKRIIKFDWLSLSFLSWFLAVIITTFTFRHVILYYPFMVAVAVDGYLDTTLNNRKIILFLSGFSAFCFGLIYVALKLF